MHYFGRTIMNPTLPTYLGGIDEWAALMQSIMVGVLQMCFL